MVHSAARGKRVALVVGNSCYRYAPLENAERDSDAVTAALERLGFSSVHHLRDASQSELSEALANFGEEADGAEMAVMYYAGHGIDAGGETYLVPVDAEPSHVRRLKFECQQLNDILPAVSGAKVLGLIMLDACRNNPFRSQLKGIEATRSVSQGLAAIEPHGNVLVAYAAKHGTVARDGSVGENSPFTRALLDFIETPNLDVRILFGKIRDAVLKRTNGAQEPHLYGSLGGGEIYLNGALAPGDAADIFLSYSQKDKDRVEPLARALQHRGWSVFWDQDLITGDYWRDVIETHLKQARCVVTVWSTGSIGSDWVRYEATHGRSNRILVPVAIDDCRAPFPFDAIQTENLATWDGRADDARITRVLLGVQRILARQPEQASGEDLDSLATRQGARQQATSPPPLSPSGATSESHGYMRLLGIGVGMALASSLIVTAIVFLGQRGIVERPFVVEKVTERIIEKSVPVLLQPPEPAKRPEPRAALAGDPHSAPTPGTPVVTTASPPKLFTPVIASMKSPDNAQELLQAVQSRARGELHGSRVTVRKDEVGSLGTYYRVVVEPSTDHARAEQICVRLKAVGFKDCFLIAQPSP